MNIPSSGRHFKVTALIVVEYTRQGYADRDARTSMLQEILTTILATFQ